MGAGHGHHDHPPVPAATRRMLFLVLAPVLVATLVGLALLWPGDERESDIDLGTPAELVDAKVIGVEQRTCEGMPEESGIECLAPVVRLLEGPDKGDEIELSEVSADDRAVDIDVGDRIVLGYYPDFPEDLQYAFADRERDRPLLLLALLFTAAVVALGRWTGVRALVAVAVSLAVLTTFVLPALLEGSSPLAVALVGSALIAVVAIVLTHGLDAASATALIGTLASLALVGILGWIFVKLCDFSGLADENANFLQLSAGQVDLRGLLLAGFVIGALGVLDDVTVTQVSAVWELHDANPSYGWRELYRAGTRIGRDHIASTVNTLVLAYAGAALPLFLLFTQAEQRLLDVVTGEAVAVEVARTLTGSSGLVASVPITTWLAAVVVAHAPVPHDHDH